MTVDTLCNNHNNIIDKLQKLKKLYKNDQLIIDFCNELLKISRHCKKQGQHMENRMKKYRTAIETLGFVRIDGRETI